MREGAQKEKNKNSHYVSHAAVSRETGHANASLSHPAVGLCKVEYCGLLFLLCLQLSPMDSPRS